MKNLEIVSTKDFTEEYGYYGYEEFLRKVLHKSCDKKEYGLVGKLKLTFAEPPKYINFENEKGESFFIHYYIEEQTEKTWTGGYQLFKEKDDENELISWGITTTHYVPSEICEYPNDMKLED